MAELRFEDFLFDVHPARHAFVHRIHQLLTDAGYRLGIVAAKSGYVVSYTDPRSKRVVLNFVFRKSGLHVRVYADHVGAYEEFLQTAPDETVKLIAKAPVCKRLVDPSTCNQRCPMGYSIEIRGERYKRCRYNCFLLPVTDGSEPFLLGLIEREVKERAA